MFMILLGWLLFSLIADIGALFVAIIGLVLAIICAFSNKER